MCVCVCVQNYVILLFKLSALCMSVNGGCLPVVSSTLTVVRVGGFEGCTIHWPVRSPVL